MTRLLTALLAAALTLSACGSDEGGTAPAPPPPASAKPADFPSARGKTMVRLVQGLAEGPIMKVSTYKSLRVGRTRLAFALVDRANKQIDLSDVAVYTSRPDGSQLGGPYVARKESLAVAAPYRSAQAATDLESGDTFYTAEAAFSSRGPHVVVGIARLDGRLVVAYATSTVPVGARFAPPHVGERAIRVHTETAADVGGDLAKLSTRVPPPRDMLDSDLADVLGRKPVVLLFATPALCQSRICGPVVDIAEQARAQSGKGVVFIQQEIYNGNDPKKGYRPQVVRWRLPSEPWAFVIDRHGRIRARFEGVFSVGELARAVEKVKAL